MWKENKENINLDEEESSESLSLLDSYLALELSDMFLNRFLVSISNSEGDNFSLSFFILAASFFIFLFLSANSTCRFSSFSRLLCGESSSLELSELLEDLESCLFLSLGLLGLIQGSCQAASPAGYVGFFLESSGLRSYAPRYRSGVNRGWWCGGW